MAVVLHITPHLGGGVGRVVSSIIDEFDRGAVDVYEHEIVCLEAASPAARTWGESASVKIGGNVSPSSASMCSSITRADIVHIHFWNHPLIYRLLTCCGLPPYRSVIWSHVNGHRPPQAIPVSVLDYPDIFVFSTGYSEELLTRTDFVGARERNDVRTVFTSSGWKHVQDVRSVQHVGFNVGYVGTVDYCKLHGNYVDLCSRPRIPDVAFIVCGGDRHEELQLEVDRAGLSGRFIIKGPVQDVGAEYATFDLFGYPLAPGHYGTGEQVLIEAMACGVVPVVLDNGPEKHIVRDGLTGVVAKTESEYVGALESLHEDVEKRLRMSADARQYARENYGVAKAVAAWCEVYDDVLSLPRREHCPILGTGSGGDPGLEAFLLSMGGTAEAAMYRDALQRGNVAARSSLTGLPSIFHSSTRGSVFHYLRHWRESPGLRALCRLQEGSTGGANRTVD